MSYEHSNIRILLLTDYFLFSSVAGIRLTFHSIFSIHLMKLQGATEIYE